jgi:hypothetical protein
MPRFVPSFLKNAQVQPVSDQPPAVEPDTTSYRRFGEPRRFGAGTGVPSTTDVKVEHVTKEIQETTNTVSRFSRGNQVISKNKFGVFGDNDDTATATATATVTTTVPKVLKPATIAELTTSTRQMTIGNASDDNTGFTTVDNSKNKNKKSFGAKYSTNKDEFQQDKKLGLPPISLPKVNSFDDFPSLGGTPKSATSTPKVSTPVASPIKQSNSSSSFANLAKGWAKKAEDDELAAEMEKQRTEKQRLEEDAFRNNISVFRKIIKKKETKKFDDDEEDELHQIDDGFGEDEDYEVPSGDEDMPMSDEDEYEEGYEQLPEKEYEERF